MSLPCGKVLTFAQKHNRPCAYFAQGRVHDFSSKICVFPRQSGQYSSSSDSSFPPHRLHKAPSILLNRFRHPGQTRIPSVSKIPSQTGHLRGNTAFNIPAHNCFPLFKSFLPLTHVSCHSDRSAFFADFHFPPFPERFPGFPISSHSLWLW